MAHIRAFIILLGSVFLSVSGRQDQNKIVISPLEYEVEIAKIFKEFMNEMDPLEIGGKIIQIDNPLLSGTVEFTNLILVGMSGAVLLEGTLEDRSKLKLSFEFEELILTSDYISDLEFPMRRIQEPSGSLRATFKNIKLKCEFIINFEEHKVVQSDVKATAFPNVQIDFETYSDDTCLSSFLSTQLTRTLNSAFKVYPEEFNKALDEYIRKLIEDYNNNPKKLENQHQRWLKV